MGRIVLKSCERGMAHSRAVPGYRYGGLCCVGGCAEAVHYFRAEEGIWIQHGENPEHRRNLGWSESAYAWLLEVHGREGPKFSKMEAMRYARDGV